MSARAARLIEREEHFNFGENWASYARLIDEKRLQSAQAHLQRLVGSDLRGKSFLDIGSGSGLFSLAALKLGADQVLAIDLDEDSVATTRSVLERFGGGTAAWEARKLSVFDLDPVAMQEFDVVYSWGVLHHTGAMWQAISKAADMTRPNGLFAFALYERSPLCRFWRIEKRIYKDLPSSAQKVVRTGFMTAYGAALLLKWRNPMRRFQTQSDRGMETAHDVHDWLGGYPYESTSLPDVQEFMGERGFDLVREYPRPVPAFGILGCGCSEYVYKRRSA